MKLILLKSDACTKTYGLTWDELRIESLECVPDFQKQRTCKSVSFFMVHPLESDYDLLTIRTAYDSCNIKYLIENTNRTGSISEYRKPSVVMRNHFKSMQ